MFASVFSYRFCLCIIIAIVIQRQATSLSTPSTSSTIKTCHFGAGCFWAPADNLQNVPGIISTSVGYCGDDAKFNSPPNYDRVCNGRTNLVEAVRVEYDSEQLKYSDMLSLFAKVNTAEYGNKRQYKGIVFTSSREEEKIAAQFLEMNKGVVAEVEPMSKSFYKAEKYHQDYWSKWRIRIAFIVTSFAIAGNLLPDDLGEKFFFGIFYSFVAFTMLERRIDTSIETIIIDEGK